MQVELNSYYILLMHFVQEFTMSEWSYVALRYIRGINQPLNVLHMYMYVYCILFVHEKCFSNFVNHLLCFWKFMDEPRERKEINTAQWRKCA